MSAPTLLIISPDYVSHLYPMAAIGNACRQRGMHVVIASGPNVESWIHSQGFDYTPLVLGPGNNGGLMRLEAQRAKEAEHMAAFYAATRRGPVETLMYQAAARRHDMLHEPEVVYSRLREIVGRTRPTLILSDQLSYSATLALHALGRPYVSFLPSNPANVPDSDNWFGIPSRWPRSIQAPPNQLAGLREMCVHTHRQFTADFNGVLARLAPDAPPVHDAFRHVSRWQVLMNYPVALATHRLAGLPPNTTFLGSSVRQEGEDPALAAFLARPSRRPTVYVSLGSFLSARDDVLTRIVRALHLLDTRAVIASGVAPTSDWGPLPDHWYVRPVLPQLQALQHADLTISHGGNNTVTETLTFGVPLLCCPFSSDQFDNAADIESAGLGESFDPNGASSEFVKGQLERLLADRAMRERAEAIGRNLRSAWGPDIAADTLMSLGKAPAELHKTAT